MRTKQAMKNMIASLMLQLVVALSGIVVPRFFTTLYGSAVNGLVASISQFIVYMGIVEAGIGAAGTVALYGPIARGEKNEINKIVSAGRTFYLRSGILFLLLVVALVAFYPMAVKNEIQDLYFIRTMIVILSVNGLVDYFFLGKYRILLQADQRGYIISVAQMIGTILMMVVSVLLMELELSALCVKSVTAIIYILRSVAISIYVKYHYKGISFHESPNMAAFSQRWSALFHQIVGMVVNNTAVVLITLFMHTNALVEISVYSVYNMVGYALSSLMMSISNGLGSGFGQVISQKEGEVLRKSYSSYEFLFFIVIFIAHTCMVALMYPFICVYSMGFADATVYPRKMLVLLFSLVGLVQSIRLPGLTLICAAGHYRETRGRALIEAILNVTLSIILIRPLGLTGVMIGILVSYLYRTIDIVIYASRHFVKKTIKMTMKRILINTFLYVCMAWLGLELIPQRLYGWTSWLVCAIIYGICVSLVFIIGNLVFDMKEGKNIYSRIRGLFFNHKS